MDDDDDDCYYFVVACVRSFAPSSFIPSLLGLLHSQQSQLVPRRNQFRT